MSFRGAYDSTEGMAAFFEDHNLAHSHSMEIKNDPRFFQDNVINYRLAAFAGVSVVSGLLVQNTMGEMWAMDKDMQIVSHRMHWNGILQLVAFSMLLIIFFANMLSMYVGVAQPYHTIRLMTAGPTGFETAASYYLNRNICAWRHLAIKSMLASLPLYISQMGLRLIVKFDRTTEVTPALPAEPPIQSRIEGYVFGAAMACLAVVLWHLHSVHFAVFRDRYDMMARNVTGNDFAQYMQQMMTGRRTGPHLDV